MKEKLNRLMSGRYGLDELGRFLSVAALIVLVLSTILVPSISGIAFGLLIICYFRVFSKNTTKRSNENLMYLHVRKKIIAFFTFHFERIIKRKTHKYFRCPTCRQYLRVPKGKGNITIKCSKCDTTFDQWS